MAYSKHLIQNVYCLFGPSSTSGLDAQLISKQQDANNRIFFCGHIRSQASLCSTKGFIYTRPIIADTSMLKRVPKVRANLAIFQSALFDFCPIDPRPDCI